MKRYLVFAYDNYYPGGGWYDFKGAYDTFESAKLEADARVLPNEGDDFWQHDCSEVVDLQIGEIIHSAKRKEALE